MASDDRINTLFKEKDTNNDGLLNSYQLYDALRMVGIEYNNDFDDTKYNYNDFVNIVRNSFSNVLYDEINKNDIVKDDQIYKLLKSLKSKTKHYELIQLMNNVRSLKHQKEHILDKDEFINFFTKYPVTYFNIPYYTTSSSVKIRDVLEGYFDTGVRSGVPSSYSYSFISGSISGLISRCVTAPLDVLRINVQISGSEPIKSVYHDILLRDGIKGLFAGNLTNCLKVIPFNGCVTWSYSIYLKLFGVEQGEGNLPLRLLCGGLSGLTATLATYPMDLIRSRLALQGRNMYYSGLINAIKTIYTEEGFHGLYKGLGVSLLSVGLFVSIQQSFQDLFRYTCFEYFEPSFPLLLSCGLLSGFSAQVITYPFDLIRRNLQLAHPAFLESQYQETDIPSKFRALVKYIYKEAGFKGFYAGLGITILKVVPTIGLGLAIRDYFLGRMNYLSPCVRINYRVNNKNYYLIKHE